MVWRSRLVAVAGLVLLLLVAAPALAARAPTLVSAGQSNGRLVANWSLPPGVETEQLVTDRVGVPDPDFGLDDTEHEWSVLGGELTESQTSFTSAGRLAPGTWYVRVGGQDNMDPGETQWSNILSFVIPRPPAPKPRPGRYSGRTEFPDSRRITFTLSRSGRRVRKLRVRFRLSCYLRGFLVGEFLNRSEFTPIPVRRGGRFARTGKVRYRGGARLRIRVKGRFRPPNRARGTVNARASIPGGVRCRYFPPGPLSWSARRR